MKSLTLFRHAKTERDSDSGRDFDRRLIERGQDDSRRVGKEISDLGLAFDLVLSSPAASPTGLGNSRPMTRSGSSGARVAASAAAPRRSR